MARVLGRPIVRRHHAAVRNDRGGSGTITSTAAGARNLSVAGTFNQPAFSATFTPNGALGINFIATVEGKTMVGTLTGGGFNGDGLALARDN